MQATALNIKSQIRYNWTIKEVDSLFRKPFMDLIFEAQAIHRQYFDQNAIQASSLLSIKTGGCPEDCKYCPQSIHNKNSVKATKLLDVDEVMENAKTAKAAGATRFCMGAAWKNPKARDIPKLAAMINGIKKLGMESCMTLGTLDKEQSKALAEAGLDYYNHNIDSSAEYYEEIITTRTYQERLDTLENVRDSGMKTCCGGIIGMGEKPEDRAKMLQTLANLPSHPESVPINMLVKTDGNPLMDKDEIDGIDFVRNIAVARIMMPKSYIRLSAGRENMSDETQALCFFAGANSIFYGEKLLTTANPKENDDITLLNKLGMHLEETDINNVAPAQAGSQ